MIFLTPILVSFLFALIGYLIGSILFSILIGKIVNVDVKSVGSKNPGATNMWRSVSKKTGIIVACLDASKSIISGILAWVIYNLVFLNPHSSMFNQSQSLMLIIYIAPLFALIGHCFPISYIISAIKNKSFNKAVKYKGGKGVSTYGGMLFVMAPIIAVVCFITWMIITSITRYVSVGSVIAALICFIWFFIPQLNYLFLLNPYYFQMYSSYSAESTFNVIENTDIILTCMSCCLISGFIVTWRHKANIERLFSKKEGKIF